MKQSLILSFLVFLAAIGLTSCKGDESSPKTSSNTSYYFTCKIDGEEFVSSSESSVVSYAADFSEYFNIQGIDVMGNKLSLTLQSPTQIGTFETGDPGTPTQTIAAHYATQSPVENWSTRDDNGKGTIIVSKNTETYMEGSFSFTAMNAIDSTTKVFTEGEFKVRKL
ncbi:MAG: hypothetical protein COA58_13505 [Bacteroidetes bacterium]|nr:MAG: hypothetical protein COA58_13505 [Bacteroidota bacterium]